MREIKFRGKRVDNSEWVYGYLQKYQETHASRLCICAVSVRTWRDALLYEVIPDTVGQFTGLLDKNGKEIYEGDVICMHHFFVKYDSYEPKPIRRAYGIEVYSDNLRTTVSYNRNYAVEFNPRKGWICRNGSDQHVIRPFDGKVNVEVIGNIHDNPELMKHND